MSNSKILLFGATGHLGKAVTCELKNRNLNFSVVVRNLEKANTPLFSDLNCIVADVTKPSTINEICKGFDVVISVLGKSVSVNDKSKETYLDIDYKGNLLILEDAVKHRIKKFVYISAFGAEKYPHLDYFKAHHDFSQKLISSGIDYSIIKPPAIFSSFTDLIDLAQKGQLVTIGKGDKRTNPIYEGDLAKVIADSMVLSNRIVEVGGKRIYTRHRINTIIQNAVNENKQVKHLPEFVFRLLLPVLKIVSPGNYHKFAFFLEVVSSDSIAPQIGNTDLEPYIQHKLKSNS